MSITLRFFLILGAVLFMSYTSVAQVAQEQTADSIRENIRRIDAMDISKSSASVKIARNQVLLKRNIELRDTLKKDIADLKELNEAAGGSDKDIQAEITKLSGELDRVVRRILTLENELTSGTSSGTALLKAEDENNATASIKPQAFVPGPMSAVMKADTQTSNIALSDALSLKEPSRQSSSNQADGAGDDADKTIAVSGTATVINEHFFQNPDWYTPEQIRTAVALRAGLIPQTQQPTSALPRIITESQAGEMSKERRRAERVLVVKNEYAQKLEVPLLLNNAKVEVIKNSDKSVVASTYTDADGKYTVLVPAEVGNYTITVTIENFKSYKSFTIDATQKAAAASTTITGQNLQLLVRPLGEYSRAIVGLEQAGASSAKSTQRFFFDLTLSAPWFRGSVHPYFGRKGRIWGTIRVTSIPQQITSPVGTFATGFAQQVSNVKVNEVAQAIEVLAGGEYRLTNRMFTFGSFDGKTANKFTLAIIGGVGAITPINPRDTLEIFKVFPGAPGLPPIPTGKELIAFVSPDRDRFFRQFYVGFRMQGYYFDYKNPDIPLQRFPASLDVTFGQNEAVTGGRLRGGVIRLEGFYPLPYEDLKFINLFGTAIIKPTRTKITEPLILEPAPAGTVVPAENVFLLTVPQINRDYYRIGVGIDFIQLVKKLGAGTSTP